MYQVKKYFSMAMLAVMFAGSLMLSVAAHAQDATPDEAMAMAKKAAEYVKANGAEAASKIFNLPQSEFIDRDLYVFAIDKQGVFLAHPIKPALVGKNMIDMKDVEGKPLIKLFTEVKGEDWVPYKWPHPVSKEIRPKKSYIIDVDGYILGVGAYYTE